MKIIREIDIPAKTVEREIGRRCDFPDCGKESNKEGAFEVNEIDVRVQVRQRDGKAYPEGGWGTVVEIDICPECFKARLIPWLESQGVVIERTEWDW